MKRIKKSSEKRKKDKYLLYYSTKLLEDYVPTWDIWFNRKDMPLDVKKYMEGTHNYHRIKTGLICIFLFKELNKGKKI